MTASLFGFLNKYKYHFLAWGIFITYEIAIARIYTGHIMPLKNYIFGYTLNISLFYLHAGFLLKCDLSNRSKIFKFSLIFLILFELILFIVFKYACDKMFYKYTHTETNREFSLSNLIYLSASLWRAILFMGYGTGYYFLKHNQQQRQLVEKMKKQELIKTIREKENKNELILTQNAVLRAQVNPHFLINTLSYLYNETRKLTPKAAESILSLTDIMQYALSKETPSAYVKLESEINLVENFLLLHQSIQPYPIQLKLFYNAEVLSIPFIPLILMSLTENIIKYGDLNDPLKPAEIRISYGNSILHIETSNHGSMEIKSSDYDTDLKNISNRLSLTYGERVAFDSYLDAKNYLHTSTRIQF